MSDNPFAELARKSRELEAKTQACPLHEWEVYVSQIVAPNETRRFDIHVATTWTADGQPIGSLVCKHCGLRQAGGDTDEHREPEKHYQEVMRGAHGH